MSAAFLMGISAIVVVVLCLCCGCNEDAISVIIGSAAGLFVALLIADACITRGWW